MTEQENLITAYGMQGAHNMPCKLCGRVDWTQCHLPKEASGYPLWYCVSFMVLSNKRL